jgi:hypothetical protein
VPFNPIIDPSAAALAGAIGGFSVAAAIGAARRGARTFNRGRDDGKRTDKNLSQPSNDGARAAGNSGGERRGPHGKRRGRSVRKWRAPISDGRGDVSFALPAGRGSNRGRGRLEHVAGIVARVVYAILTTPRGLAEWSDNDDGRRVDVDGRPLELRGAGVGCDPTGIGNVPDGRRTGRGDLDGAISNGRSERQQSEHGGDDYAGDLERRRGDRGSIDLEPVAHLEPGTDRAGSYAIRFLAGITRGARIARHIGRSSRSRCNSLSMQRGMAASARPNGARPSTRR